MTFFNKDMMNDLKKSRKKIELQNLLTPFVVGASYYFLGTEAAILVALVIVCHALNDLKSEAQYRNFMLEKSIGLHDL